MESPRNRKQRRAARSNSSSNSPSIPLARPPRELPKTRESSKTLVDLIAERQATIPNQNQDQNFEIITIDPSTLSEHDTGPSPPAEILPDQPLPPLIDTILLSLPLSTLHLTLAYLAAHQYADETHLPSLFRESAFVALPMLTLLIHLAHGHVISFDGRSRRDARKGQGRRKHNPPPSSSDEVASFVPLSREKFTPSFVWKLLFPPRLRTSIFLSLAIFLGTKLVSITNEDPYYAVMKRAPAIGTLWVWSILELPVGAAIIGALGPLGWGVWWMGYGIV